MTCPDCERYKQSASMWRNKAYELNGTPLPWKPDDLWVGLTPEEIDDLFEANGNETTSFFWVAFARAIEAKLKEKNS